ncbi:hypothetical protein HDU85_002632 [Gaertneriomyces sp. JEL0708]|nr:hypothetical protein HDU85_002632 [Gaertneriomyces sp. JEL0708]
MVSHGDENACERVALGQANSGYLIDDALSVAAKAATQNVEASADGIFGAGQLNILDDVENTTPCINVKERVKAINRQYPAKTGHGPAFSLPVKTRVKKLLDKVNGSDSDIPVPHTPSRKAAATAKRVSKGRLLFQAMPVAAEEVPSELSEQIPGAPVPRATTPPASTGPPHDDGEAIAPLTPRRSRRINKDVGETVAAGSLTPRRSRRLAQADAGDEAETLGLAPLTPRRSRRLVIGCESPSRRTREPLKIAEASADAPMPSTPSRRGRPKKAEMNGTSDEAIQAIGPSIFGRSGTPIDETSPAKAECIDAGASIHPSPSKTLNTGMAESINSTATGFVLKSEESPVDDRSTVSESMGSTLVSTDFPDMKTESSSSEPSDIRVEVTSVLEVESSLGSSSTPLEPVASELTTFTPVDVMLCAETETELLFDAEVANEMSNGNATQDKAPCDLPDDGNEAHDAPGDIALNDDKAESKVPTTSDETQSADDINVGERLIESQPASLPERESLKRKLDDSDDEEEEETTSEMAHRPIRAVKKLKTEAGAINVLAPPNITKIVDVQLEELESDEEDVEEWDSDTDDEDEFAEAGWLMSVFLRTAKTIGLR